MLSASHNPMPDNGIKFFARGGHKLPDERRGRHRAPAWASAWERPTGADVGRIRPLAEAADRYVGTCCCAPCRTASTACGSSSTAPTARPAWPRPEALRAAGADVVVIGAEPDGLNINDGCGSTHLEPLREAVVAHGADVGIAHDGDADRCLAVDATGRDVDGDQIMAILALALQRARRPASTTPSSPP